MNVFIKAHLCFFLALLFLIFSIPATAAGVDDETEPNIPIITDKNTPSTDKADAVYMYNLENDCVLVSKNTEKIIFPASTVKIMTGIVALEKLASRRAEKVTLTTEMLAGAAGNRMKLSVGEVISVESLLYGALCGGYNDASLALAVIAGGSVEGFATLMNEKAAALGATDTNYVNPTGLHDPSMVTTAADTAKIALYAMENADFMNITSTVKYTVPANNKSAERNIYNRNALIATATYKKYYNPSARGLNAGATNEGGCCVVTSAEKDGLTYLCIVMNAAEDIAKDINYAYILAGELLDYAFSDYGYVTVIEKGNDVGYVDVKFAEGEGKTAVITSEAATLYLPLSVVDGLKYTMTLARKSGEKSLTAPIAAGEVVGVYTVSYEEEIIASVPVVTAGEAKRNAFLFALNAIADFTKSRVFILFLIIFLPSLAAYFYLTSKKRKRRGVRRRRIY